LDELQAAFLRMKLKKLNWVIERRREVAAYYLNNINNSSVILPTVINSEAHVWHLFVLRVKEREQFQRYLSENKIETVIHYPIPPHKQPAYQELNSKTFPLSEKIHSEVISLPLSEVMEQHEIARVVEIINGYS
jgi:dTDP-4-amino-4,6-dideoxygalactose transaminase